MNPKNIMTENIGDESIKAERVGRTKLEHLLREVSEPCLTSTYLSPVSLVRHFQSLASGKDLPTREELFSSKSQDWFERKSPRIFCLRTFLGCYPMIKAEHLQQSLIRFANWGIAASGRCLTAKILASPNPGAECSLSDILIEDAPERYYLSLEQTQKLLYNSLVAHKGSGCMTQMG